MFASAWLLALAIGGQVPPAFHMADLKAVAALKDERQKVIDDESGRLARLAETLAAAGKGEEAERVRKQVEPAEPKDGPTRFVPLSEVVPAAKPGLASVPTLPAEAEAIRSRTAKALFDLAGRAAAKERLALADACLRGVLAREPDHAEARRLMGYVRHDGGWATRFASQRLKEGWMRHPTYGWVNASWVAHLDRGELPGRSFKQGQPTEWLPAERADAIRANVATPWSITTEHFLIKANVPLAEAIAFVRRLEDFHDAFFALMADVIGPELHPLALRYRGAEPKKQAPHRVYYFADRQQFVAYLASKRVDAGDSLGYYDGFAGPNGKQAPAPSLFFRDPGGEIKATETLYHEVSHQLLFESAGASHFDRNPGNIWVFEGLGTYFETVEPQADGSLRIGGRVGARMARALERLVSNREMIPLGRFIAMDKDVFRSEVGGAVYLHYAQAIALATFLMQYDHGRYRDPFLAYVRDAYKGRLHNPGTPSLAQRLGTLYPTLERQLLTFLAESPGP
ncbi:MAG TPA: DUF1570 domain-containing protein [Isosphaeraceae bacterium]|jgi:hypothetical protein|nr:DUF1570 domain-containing protein [Isosphaeraceae bacterium]